MQDVIEKAALWKEAISHYDQAVADIAQIIISMSEAKKAGEEWKLDDMKKEHKTKINGLNEEYVFVETAQDNLVMAILSQPNSDTKNILMSLMTRSPYFAGLDEKATEALSAKAKDSKDLKSVAYVHDIYVDHIKMMADKIIELIDKS